jgi:hypothetical protein
MRGDWWEVAHVSENIPGNGRVPDDGSSTVRQSETQPDNTLTYMDRFMAERSAAPAKSQLATAQTLASTVPTASSPGEPAAPEGITPTPVLTADDVTLLDDPSLQLLMRFLVGSAVVGVEELLSRVRRWDEQTPADPLSAGGRDLKEATNLDLARYLIVGSLIWGRRQMVRTVRSNLIGSPGKPPVLLQSIDRATTRWPLSSLREPFKRAAASLSAMAEQRIREGWREEQAARWLASNTIGEIIDDFIDHISENPQLVALVREQINQQSIGLASTVRDTGREWSVTGDDLVEVIVRRLLRRRPRSELPGSSPIVPTPGAEDRRGQ